MTDQPMPAEAATDVGANQDVRRGMQMLVGLIVALVLLCAAGLVVDF